MAGINNYVSINQLVNQFWRTNIFARRLLARKGITAERPPRAFELYICRRGQRALSPFNCGPVLAQRVSPSTLLSDNHLSDFFRISVRSISSSSSQQKNQNRTSYVRYKLSDVVETPYGFPATMKELSLSKQIIDCVIYNDNDLIAFNKPLGVHVYGQTIPGQEDELGYGVLIDPDLPPKAYACIADIMPILRHHFQCPKLQIVHSIKMYYTGVLIMVKNEKAKDAVIQAIDRSKSPGLPYQTYLGVTYGIPQIESVKESTLFLTQKKYQGEHITFPSKSISKSLRKQGKIQKVNIQCTVLKRNHIFNCALVRFDTSKDKYHSTEVFATEELCSILGDYLYSTRVVKISDIPVKIEPHCAEVGIQKLPPVLKKLLIQNPGEQMPLHLHRAKVDLRNFQKKKSTLSILAPYPPYFDDTLNKLNLHLPFADIFKDSHNNDVDA